MKFAFITDLHITGHSNVRSGDVLTDICSKLDWVVNYCNSNDLILLVGGDVFDKPTVPDFVKNKVFPIFHKCINKPIMICGNHDCLYNNSEYDYKTSYQTLVTSGLVTDLNSYDYLDLGEVLLTSKLPIITRNKPQIVIYHGFLNIEDGNNTILFQDIQTKDECLILLGHDHVEYEPLVMNNVTIVRPGSFLRGIRNDTNLRQPNLVVVSIEDNKFSLGKVPILCRDWNEIFKESEFKLSSSQKKSSYSEILTKMKSMTSQSMTFEQALNMVTEPVVSDFIIKSLSEEKLRNNFNKI